LYFALLALAGAAIWGTYRWLLERQLSQLFGI
jgi:type VI secretion system protein ImpK